ncbi:MAG: hypothetical protein P8Y70_01520 [Candidatus Lokiarchaeota archaeon]
MGILDKITNYVIALIVMASMLPLGIITIANIANSTATVGNTTYTWSGVVNPTLTTLVTVLIPIMVIISLLVYFIPRRLGKQA